MRTTLFLSCLLVPVAIALTSCGYVSPVVPPRAGWFTGIGAPTDIEFDRTTIGPHQGKASSVSVLGIIAFGNASPISAARNANIRQIDQIDHEYLNILGLYQSYTTVVSGWGDDSRRQTTRRQPVETSAPRVEAPPQPEVTPPPPPQRDAVIYYILINDRQSGPHDEQAIRQMISTNILDRDTYVWRSDQEDWQRLSELEEFRRDLGPPPSPAP